VVKTSRHVPTTPLRIKVNTSDDPTLWRWRARLRAVYRRNGFDVVCEWVTTITI
jgi:hypothetical protein